eukprot:649394-Alexandrium_andersonii.AAC.1
MTLFVIAFGPILRWISASLPPESWLFGYCDDLAVATADGPATWKIMIGLFLVVARMANLRLNVSKTQIWVIVAGSREAVTAAIRALSPDLPLAAF